MSSLWYTAAFPYIPLSAQSNQREEEPVMHSCTWQQTLEQSRAEALAYGISPQNSWAYIPSRPL